MSPDPTHLRLTGPPLEFFYLNWRGERAWRNVQPVRVRFAEDQKEWVLDAFCLDRQALRTFNLKNIEAWRQ